MSNYTTSLGLEEVTPGDQAGLWGNTTNNNLALIDQAIAGVTPVYLDSKSGFTYILTNYNGAFDEARAAVINVTYQSTSATGANIVQIPSAQKLYVFRNSSGQGITVQTSAATYTVTIANGEATLVFCDGLNAYPGIATAGVGTLTVPYGGTGVTAFSSTPGFIYTAGGTSALTSVAAVSLNSSVAGTLPVDNGGTGVNSFASGTLLVGNGTSNLGTLTGGTAGNVATWNGSTWTSAAPASSGVTSFNGRTNAVTPQSGDYSSYYYSSSNPSGFITSSALTSYAQLSGATFTGAVTYSSGGGYSGLSSNSVVIGNSTSGISCNGTSTIGFQVNSAGYANLTSGKLEVYAGGGTSSISATDSSTGSCQLGAVGYGVARYSGNIVILNNAGNASVDGSGNFSISGSVGQKASGTTWSNPSDIRLKDNISPYEKGLSDLLLVNPKTWVYNGKGGTVSGTNGLGVIADEIESVLPKTVDTYSAKLNEGDAEDTDIKRFDATEITWLLVNSVKELKAIVDAQAAEIAALKAK